MIQEILKTIDEELCTRIYNSENNDILVLLLHGAGTSNQNRLESICLFLQNKGINCISFDFSGHGLSSQNKTSSLNKKFYEASFVYEYFKNQYKNIHIFAFSMSGQIAVNLIEKYQDIKSITLFAPALYNKQSFNIDFGEDFTKSIRMHESWKGTNAYNILKRYNGFVNLVIPEHDNIIPVGVIDIYRGYSKPSNFQEIFLKNAPHTIGKWIEENPNRFEYIFKKISNTIK